MIPIEEYILSWEILYAPALSPNEWHSDARNRTSRKPLRSKLVQKDAGHCLPGQPLVNVLLAALDEVVVLDVILDVVLDGILDVMLDIQ